jgi:hypothetical protein
VIVSEPDTVWFPTKVFEPVVASEPVFTDVPERVTSNVLASPFVNVIVFPAADAVTKRDPVGVAPPPPGRFVNPEPSPTKKDAVTAPFTNWFPTKVFEPVVAREPVFTVVPVTVTLKVLASPFVNVIVFPAADAVTNNEPVGVLPPPPGRFVSPEPLPVNDPVKEPVKEVAVTDPVMVWLPTKVLDPVVASEPVRILNPLTLLITELSLPLTEEPASLF